MRGEDVGSPNKLEIIDEGTVEDYTNAKMDDTGDHSSRQHQSGYRSRSV